MKGLSLQEEHPRAQASNAYDELLIRVFAKLDKTALGVAVGVVLGMLIFLATIFLVARGDDPRGPHLALIGQYFIGFSVTWTGSVVGFAYGSCLGFLLGWSVALFRNGFLDFYVHAKKMQANLSSISDFIDSL